MQIMSGKDQQDTQNRFRNRLEKEDGSLSSKVVSEEEKPHLKDLFPIDSENQTVKIITILFMSHRIQAKIYSSDTYDSFMDRLRLILPNICKDN